MQPASSAAGGSMRGGKRAGIPEEGCAVADCIYKKLLPKPMDVLGNSKFSIVKYIWHVSLSCFLKIIFFF